MREKWHVAYANCLVGTNANNYVLGQNGQSQMIWQVLWPVCMEIGHWPDVIFGCAVLRWWSLVYTIPTAVILTVYF